MIWPIGMAAFGLLLIFMCLILGGMSQKTDRQIYLQVPPTRPDKLVTVGRWETSSNYRDTKKPYHISVILRESASGLKDVEILTSEDFVRKDLDEKYNSARNHLIKWFKRCDIYQLKLVPWLEGTFTTEDLKIMETGITWIEKPVVSTLITSEGSLQDGN